MNGANEPSKSSPDQSDQQQPQSSGNSVIHPSSSSANAAPHHFVPLEFWTNMLARSNAAAVANANNGVLQPQPIKTNIRLPPAFNLTATIQHLLQNPGTASQMMPMAHQNPALVLRQALLGLMMGGGGGNEVPEGIDAGVDYQQRPGKGVDSPEERNGTAQQHFVPSMLAQEEADEQMLDVDLKNDDLEEPLGLQVDTHFPASREADEEEQAATIDGTPNNNGGSHRLQQRRARVGGSSAKTAEVWRFFSPRPDGEQAATCSICQKTIKATNSSTTGMIRHLKSVHHDEHKILQQARALRALKNSDETMREQMLRQWGFNSAQAEGCSLVAIQNALESSLSAMQYPTDQPPSMPPVPKHSVEALLINGGDGTSPENNRDFPLSPGFNPAAMAAQLAQLPVEQRQLLEQIENFKTSRPTSIERLQQQQQKKELAGGGGGKRMAEEAGSISPKSAGGTQREENNSFKEPKRPKQELAEQHAEHGVQATEAKVPTPAVNGTPKAGGNGPKKKPRKHTTIVPVQQLAKADQNEEKEEKLEEELDERQREESTRISEQMAAMFLVDNTEFLLDRVAFRQFIQSILPHYRMPSKEQFRREIIPRVGCQLDQLALFREELQRNNPFGVPMPPTIVQHQQHSQQQLNSSTNSSTSACQSSSSPVLSTPSMSNNSVISPSSSAEESGFHDEESIALGELQHPQLVVQQAAIRSQNISRGFTYSIDLSVSGNEGQQHGSGGNAS